MEEQQVRVFRASAGRLLLCGSIYVVALVCCFALLDQYVWVAALGVTFFNVPFLGGEWLRLSQNWLLLDWNGVTVSTPDEIRFVSWREAEGIVRAPLDGKSSAYEYRVLRNGALSLKFDDSILDSDEAAEIIEECIERVHTSPPSVESHTAA